MEIHIDEIFIFIFIKGINEQVKNTLSYIGLSLRGNFFATLAKIFRWITPFFKKQSIFDPRPENCLIFSKKLP